MASYEDRILRVLAHIHNAPAGDLSLDALADVAALSRFHFHRIFRAMTGETCAQAVRRVRLHRAACWLVQTDRSMPEIAALCGYAGVPSFTRAFAEAYGQPPAAFRGQGRLRPPLIKPEKGQTMEHPIEILDQPARRLAALPHRGAYFEIGQAFEQLSTLFGARGLWPHARGMVGVYYDDPDAVAEAELRSHAGVSVDESLAIDTPMEELNLPAGRYAVMHYTGPYSGLKGAYAYMYGNWLPASGQELGDHPPIEVYLNAPGDVPPEELRTDVCVPLAEAKGA